MSNWLLGDLSQFKIVATPDPKYKDHGAFSWKAIEISIGVSAYMYQLYYEIQSSDVSWILHVLWTGSGSQLISCTLLTCMECFLQIVWRHIYAVKIINSDEVHSTPCGGSHINKR